MRCKEFEQKLPDFVTNKLPIAEMQDVRGHLKSCVRCRKKEENLRSTFILLDNVKSLERASAPKINLLPGIRTRVYAGKKVRTPWVSYPRFVRYAAAPAAVLILGLFLLLGPSTGGNNYPLFTEQEKESLFQNIDTESLEIEELLASSQTSFEEITSNSLLDMPDNAFITVSESFTLISTNDALSYALITTDPEDILESLPSEVSEDILKDFEKQSLL